MLAWSTSCFFTISQVHAKLNLDSRFLMFWSLLSIFFGGVKICCRRLATSTYYARLASFKNTEGILHVSTPAWQSPLPFSQWWHSEVVQVSMGLECPILKRPNQPGKILPMRWRSLDLNKFQKNHRSNRVIYMNKWQKQFITIESRNGTNSHRSIGMRRAH